MSDVDKLQNAEEAVSQEQEETQRAAKERTQKILKNDPLDATADKERHPEMIKISEISAITNMRRGTPEIDELAINIREHGLLTPLVVQPSDDKDKPFRLIAGQRRLAALKKLSDDNMEVPCLVVEGLDEAEVLEIQFAENLYLPPEPLEFARAARTLMSKRPSWTASQIAARQGVKESWLQKHLKLLELPETVISKVESGDLSFTVADLLRRGLSKDQLTEEEVAELAENDASVDEVRQARGMVGSNPVGEGYVPPLPEGYEEWAEEDARKRWDKERGEKGQAHNDKFDDDWEEDEEWDEGENNWNTSAAPSRRSKTSDEANTSEKATVKTAITGDVSEEKLRRYLLGKLLHQIDAAALEEFNIEEPNIWVFASELEEKQIEAYLQRVALALLACDNHPPHSIFK